MNEVDYKLTIW